MTLGERIKARRTALGMSQALVARKAGLWPHDVYRFETGRNTPGLESIEKLAEALGVTAAYLAFGDSATSGGTEPAPVACGEQ